MTVTLYHGDCLDTLPTLEAGSVDAVVTDPPYGIALENHGQFAWTEGQVVVGDYSPELGQAVLDWAASLGLCVVTFASPWGVWDGDWRNLLVWDKGPAVGGGGDFRTCWKRTWELVQIARNPPLNGKRDASVYKRYVGPSSYHLHPNQKPTDFVEYLVGKVTQPGATVLDPFMGSGTTGVACVQTGRNFIGIEIDEGYFDIAQQRIEAAQAEMVQQEMAI